jgi:hypothetical protein
MVRLASDLVETSKLNKPGIFHVTFVSALQRINVLSIVLNERAEDIETREGIQ